VDERAVAQAVAAAVLGALPVRALADAFLLGAQAGLLGVAAAALVLTGRGAAPVLVGAVGGIRLLLLVVLAWIAWLGGALLPARRRAGARGTAAAGGLTPPGASLTLAVKPREALEAVPAGYEGRERPRTTRASLRLQRLA
jgi:hypothetical protein